MFDILGRTSLFRITLLDMKSAHWSVKIAEKDIPKTAFVVENFGTYKSLRMPFGLTNAPSTFQSLVEKLLPVARGGEIGEMNFCLAFLDYLLIPADSDEQALDRPQKLLQAIVQNGLKLNAKKCQILQTEVTYLGHTLNKEGISCLHSRICKMQNWPTPRSKRDVRALCGIFNYYSQFVNRYAEIAAPFFRADRRKETV